MWGRRVHALHLATLRYLGHTAATGGDAGSASGACVFTLFVPTLLRLVTSRPSLFGVSAQMQGAGVPASDSTSYSHSYSLDSVAEMVATATSTTVSNIVGMIGTEASLSVQKAAMRAQWYVLLPCPHRPSTLSASTSSPIQTRRPTLKHTYTSPASNASPRSRRVHGHPLQHPRRPEAPRRTAGARARTRPARPVDAT